MKKSLYIFSIAVVLLLFFVQCSKFVTEGELPEITFGVSGTGVDVETKGLITDFSNLYVYGVRNNTNPIFTVSPAINNIAQLEKIDGSENWKASGSYVYRWLPGSSYSFHGYTSSSSFTNGASLSIESYGLKITVNQPGSTSNSNTFSEDAMVDYMLSHAYKVADGSNYHVVMLNMQHAMACVEIVVNKEDLYHTVKLKEISLNNIFRSAVMQCESQAIANSGSSNVWNTTLSGSNNTSYTKEFAANASDSYWLGSMRVLTVPQQLTANTELSVKYTVDQGTGEVEHTDVFRLHNYNPYVWLCGHKITYTLNINTGVQLEAKVSDWVAAGYIEGVIFPK